MSYCLIRREQELKQSDPGNTWACARTESSTSHATLRTLARDLKKLMAAGYSLDKIKAFDMFPQTHHVETVVHLSLSHRQIIFE